MKSPVSGRYRRVASAPANPKREPSRPLLWRRPHRLAGLKPHPKMQGSNLADVLTGRSSKSPDSAYLAIHGSYQGDDTPGAWRGIRTRKHVYAKFKDKPWMLHDIEKDPFEMRNLVDERSAAPLLREMERQLERKMKETGDAWSNDWTGLPEDAGRLYRHRTFYTVGEYQEWAKANPEAAAAK